MDPLPTLATTPARTYWFSCPSCGRTGRYGTTALLRLLPPETPVQDLPKALAAARGCPVSLGASAGQCRADFDLAAQVLAEKREADAAKWERR